MKPELEQYYEQQFDLFMHPGWKDFMEDIEKVLDPLEEIMTLSDAASLHKRQGQIDILRWVRDRKQMLDAAYKELREPEELNAVDEWSGFVG